LIVSTVIFLGHLRVVVSKKHLDKMREGGNYLLCQMAYYQDLIEPFSSNFIITNLLLIYISEKLHNPLKIFHKITDFITRK